jgi:hypothetical protein
MGVGVWGGKVWGLVLVYRIKLMNSNRIYFAQEMGHNCLDCTYHNNSQKCFVYIANNNIVHVTPYEGSGPCDNYRNQRTPIQALAPYYLSLGLKNWCCMENTILRVTNTPFSILIETILPHDAITIHYAQNKMSRNQTHNTTNVVKYYIQLYAFYVFILKEFPCCSESDINVKEWNFVSDKKNDIFLVDGFSINLSSAIIYSVKEKLGQQRGLDIMSDLNNCRFSKSLRSIRKKHALHCINNANNLSKVSHKWINLLNESAVPKVVSRIYCDFKMSTFKLNPLTIGRIKSNYKNCSQFISGPCCFLRPELMENDAHKLFCKTNFHAGIEILKYGTCYPGKCEFLCRYLIDEYEKHVTCRNCKPFPGKTGYLESD